MSEDAKDRRLTRRQRVFTIGWLWVVYASLMVVDNIARDIFGLNTEGALFGLIFWMGLVGSVVLSLTLLYLIAQAARDASSGGSSG